MIDRFRKPRKPRAAFTLIELMLVVGILGILAALALPVMGGFIRRSKTSEAPAQLSSLFQHAAAYYNVEHNPRGINVVGTAHCTVPMAGPRPSVPKPQKQKFEADQFFKALNFTAGDLVYYSYSLQGPEFPRCDHPKNKLDLYTFRAQGDLNGNSRFSTFELAAATDSDNELYHARAIYMVDAEE